MLEDLQEIVDLYPLFGIPEETRDRALPLDLEHETMIRESILAAIAENGRLVSATSLAMVRSDLISLP